MMKRHNMFVTQVALMLQGLSLSSLRREEGQTLTEYALILALIAVAVIAVVITLGGKITGIFNNVSSNL